jgi:hypothetical protein
MRGGSNGGSCDDSIAPDETGFGSPTMGEKGICVYSDVSGETEGSG